MLHSLSGWDDTIVALATPNGAGAIGVIRISGTKAIDIAASLFPSKDLHTQATHTLHVGNWCQTSNTTQSREVIDEVVVSLFKGSKSYTGENVVEISCHGSAYIQEQIITAITNAGARLALPGEFTQRAFLNGKLDLAQAEAVADLIASENKASHQIALQQLKGGISTEMQGLRESLIQFTALLELELDFSDEDVEFADRKKLLDLINNIEDRINSLKDSFTYGNAIKNGVPVAIVGKPNVGKSSLLNVLLKENRAIVSNIPGTTRDTIEEQLVIDGIKFRLIDTAGIRDTTDEIEHLGIRRTFEKAKTSAIVLYLFDKNAATMEEVAADYTLLKTDSNEVYLCLTKTDLYEGYNWEEWIRYLKEKTGTTSLICISSKTHANIDELKNILSEPFTSHKRAAGAAVIVNQRHADALRDAAISLQQSKQGLQDGLSGDLVSIYLKDAIRHIGSITGHVDVDKDILGAIFTKFCIGK